MLKLIDVVDGFIGESAEFINSAPQPLPGSRADQEMQSGAEPKFLLAAYGCGSLLLESAIDHLMALSSSLKEPAKTLAPSTCTRGVLEHSAIGAWLMDPSIDANDRIKRQFAYRFEGQLQQRRLAASEGDRERMGRIDARMAHIERTASFLGMDPIRNRRGEKTGLAVPWPGPTALIGDILGMERPYRILSSIAHGHAWAMQSIGFHVKDPADENGIVRLQKRVHPPMVAFLANVAVPSCSLLLGHIGEMFGWDSERLRSFIVATFEKVEYHKGHLLPPDPTKN